MLINSTHGFGELGLDEFGKDFRRGLCVAECPCGSIQMQPEET